MRSPSLLQLIAVILIFPAFIVGIALATNIGVKPTGEYAISADSTLEYNRKLTVRSYTFKEHQFLQFGSGTATWGVHDPNCLNKKHYYYENQAKTP